MKYLSPLESFFYRHYSAKGTLRFLVAGPIHIVGPSTWNVIFWAYFSDRSLKCFEDFLFLKAFIYLVFWVMLWRILNFCMKNLVYSAHIKSKMSNFFVMILLINKPLWKRFSQLLWKIFCWNIMWTFIQPLRNYTLQILCLSNCLLWLLTLLSFYTLNTHTYIVRFQWKYGTIFFTYLPYIAVIGTIFMSIAWNEKKYR